MPVVFRQNGFRFHFFSNEGDPLEPPHVHVTKDGHNAKFWLQPDVAMAYSYGFSPRALSELVKVVALRRAEIEKAWHEHFG